MFGKNFNFALLYPKGYNGCAAWLQKYVAKSITIKVQIGILNN